MLASVEILRRGVAAFPRDWELAWVLGLRLFLDVKGGTEAEERQRKEEGAAYIEHAMRLPGAPNTLPYLAASLRSKLGQKERALHDLREMILNTEDEKARAELVARYSFLVNDTASNELAAAAAEFDGAWRTYLPFASRALFVLLGPPPDPAFDLTKHVFQDTIEDGTVIAP